MGLWELLGVLVGWGIGAGLGAFAWRRTPAATEPRPPVPVPMLLLAVALCAAGSAASILLGGTAARALLAGVLTGEALLTGPSDGAWMHAHAARALWFVLGAPWAATAVSLVVAPHRVGRAFVLAAAVALGMVGGGGLALPLVAGMVASLEQLEGDAVLLAAVDVVSGAANSALLLGYGVAAALAVPVVASASRQAWRQCVLGLGIWALCAWLWSMLLTPPDVVTMIMGMTWLIGGWVLGLVLGWRPAR